MSDLFRPPDTLTRPMLPAGGAHQPSVRIVAPARHFGPRTNPALTRPRPMAAVRRVVDPWVARAVLDAGWPADLVAAGVDVSGPMFPAWHPDVCGAQVVAQGVENTLPCTLDPDHTGLAHQVWSTTGALVAEAAPARPSPRPRTDPVEPVAVAS